MQRLVIIIVTLIIMVTLLPAAALAGGPPKKVTGSFTVYELEGPGHRVIDINAHAAHNKQPARGRMTDTIYIGNSTQPHRAFEFDVKYVEVAGSFAYVGLLCTSDTSGEKTGQWLYVKIHDAGSPGIEVDYIGWDWGSESDVASRVNAASGGPGVYRNVLSGNLVIHGN